MKNILKISVFVSLIILTVNAVSQEVKIALLKYQGGGDWYANPTSLTNLVTFCNNNIKTNISTEISAVNIGSPELFNYPLVHLTGHGNIILNPEEVQNLRKYLTVGGFLHVSDNYGLDEYFRREMKKVFPEAEFIKLPSSHPIYHQKYDFDAGIPKIHEHNDKDPQGLAIIYKGRVVCFYDYESDLGDGWEDADVHHDSEEKRLEALKMGANIVQYVFEN